MRVSSHRLILAAVLGAFFSLLTGLTVAQSISSGTIEGVVNDPSGAVVPGAKIELHNDVTGYSQSAATDHNGAFRLTNIPLNPYHLHVTVAGFQDYEQDVTLRSTIPVSVTVKLALAGAKQTVTVEAAGAAMLENEPTAHVDVDRNVLNKIIQSDPAGGLSQAITYSTGGVAADGNGLFHPLGDHAQVTFVIDGQPISDQQSKVFSTQLPTSAIQNMEVNTGTPTADYGDKSSLIANITTRSGLGSDRIFGSVDATFGNFGTGGGSIGLGWGNAKFGNFIAIDGIRTTHFLDTPEFVPYHDTGNNQTIFDRMDYQPTGVDALHLNVFLARNWIQIPNSLDQLAQDQHQRVLTWSVAPSYQHTFNSHMLLTVNPYVREDEFSYYGSRDVFNDQPATQNQTRHLMNWGVKSDLGISKGRHQIKVGIDVKQTRLFERFGFGITDPTFNDPCIDSTGSPIGDPTLTNPTQCAGSGYEPNVSSNPNSATPFSTALFPYDLTRGGKLFNFTGSQNINQAAFYVTDSISAGNFVFNLGLREDIYRGISSDQGLQPRTGVAYNIKKTGTVLRGAYARTFETPFNENLILSSATGAGGLASNLFGSSSLALHPGRRNQYNVGLQQAIGKWLLMDADYFWKYTNNAYDFSTLLNTTITFPISWNKSKLDGVTGRVSTVNLHGFQAFFTFGHTRARYFPPEVGGLVPQGAPLAAGVFRIDHDQAFQSTMSLRYQRPKNAEWIALTWRYDSGLVVSGVPDAGAALALTPNQQVSIGLACNGAFATVADPLSDCVGHGGTMGLVTSKLITLPQGGYDNFASQENDDHNPDRVKPRSLFNLGIGTDNLTHAEGRKRLIASLEITNLTNKVALYNFLSTFSGTHFVAPRTLQAKLGFVF
jgi:hypothetical protein